MEGVPEGVQREKVFQRVCEREREGEWCSGWAEREGVPEGV